MLYTYLKNNRTTIIALLAFICLLSACGDKKKNKIYTSIANDESVKPSFLPVKGIRYSEVRRAFASGVIFNEDGYQLEPEWHLSFLSDDSVNIYNPKRKMFVNAPVLFDHDSLFNVAWSWLRLRKLSRDSIIFQVMKVKARKLMRDSSIVYMTLYADDYIKNKLHTSPAELMKPRRADTLFIRKKAEEAARDTDKAFSAREQATLKSKTPLLTIKQIDNIGDDDKREGMLQDYMLPEYNISIKNAYDDFSYGFSVRINADGSLHYLRSVNFIYEEFRDASNRAMRGIVDGYFKAYIDVKPGYTLGIPHASFIIVNVTGEKKKGK
ncbi:hypothetical protein [Mucilaginibacter pedocola]|uniref:Uncharacterized protein n=1 Tax=Mucilaginibacter pedocola TaxID=1792845 RepID=A0A1S9P7T1_9SPHI|nr:hypothetical protein [Mucilaginibacter pedocola]OOQ57015.1 hypothetical protein BC343_15865 [Mucilaginibacter pedocola]